MDNVTKWILLGAGVLVTIGIIIWGISMYDKSAETNNQASAKLDNVNSQMLESDITMYDGLSISGGEVINVIRKMQDDYISIKVVTKADTSGTCYIYNSTVSGGVANLSSEIPFDVSKALDPTDSKYIYPQGNFEGEVIRDANGAPVLIEFTQK